jgi:polyisoprenoid-binding protein YceI
VLYRIQPTQEETAMAISEPALTRVLGGVQVPAPGVYEFDPGHTTIEFEGRHLLINRVRGRFLDFAGLLQVGNAPEDSNAELTIQAASLDSGLRARDDHLRSPDFLDVERHPTITFRSTSIDHVEGDRWRATGDLTIRDVSRPVVLAVAFGGAARDPWGNEKIGFSVRMEFNREDFGLTWNMVLESGGLVAGKRIRVEIDVEATRQQ